jgi:hypothetical protein
MPSKSIPSPIAVDSVLFSKFQFPWKNQRIPKSCFWGAFSATPGDKKNRSCLKGKGNQKITDKVHCGLGFEK